MSRLDSLGSRPPPLLERNAWDGVADFLLYTDGGGTKWSQAAPPADLPTPMWQTGLPGAAPLRR